MNICIRSEDLTMYENVLGIPAQHIGTGGFGFYGISGNDKKFFNKPSLKHDETYYTDRPYFDFINLYNYFQQKISEFENQFQQKVEEFEEPIDYNSRLYPEGDRTFGDFIPGKSHVKMPTFSFIKQEKILPTLKEEIIETEEE